MNEVRRGSKPRQRERQHSRWMTGAVASRAYRDMPFTVM